MRFLRNLKISRSLHALFGCSAVLLSGQALNSAVDAFDRQRQAVQVAETSAVNRELFAALQEFRAERGPTHTAPAAKDAADPRPAGCVAGRPTARSAQPSMRGGPFAEPLIRVFGACAPRPVMSQ